MEYQYLLHRLFAMLLILLLPSCGYNTFQSGDEQIKASWSEVLNQYQRRADLIPNLVKTVEGYTTYESETLLAVTNARSNAMSAGAVPNMASDPKAFAKFEAAQRDLSSALGQLRVVVERYPDLKANENFRDLQAQLEGTENRITVARNRYITAVKDYNTAIRSFPSNLTALLFGYAVKPNFTVADEARLSQTPTIEFDLKRKPSEENK